jgi:PAS domain S-box-containing protein
MALKKDFTECPEPENAPKDADQQLKAIVCASPIPQFVIDRKHRIIYWNKALEEISGIRCEEVIGTKQQWKAFYSEERPCMADLLLDGEIEKISEWYDGRYSKSRLVNDAYEATDFFPSLGKEGKWLYFTAALIRDSKGTVMGAVETLEDITERKKAEEELRKAHQELEQKVIERTRELTGANLKLQELDRLKSMFISSMSHELRTPLNSIIGFTSVILMGMAGEITGEQQKQLTMVKNSANHLLGLINDIIDSSKIEAGKMELAVESFDLANLVKEVKDSFAVDAERKGLKLSFTAPEELAIESDQRRIKQILLNLINNAIKFTDKGEIEVHLEDKEGKAIIVIRDTGIGIKREDMGKIFLAFSQIHTQGRVKEGTGLGLYLSQKISGLLGGQITVESQFDKGSEFTFSLPLKYKRGKV